MNSTTQGRGAMSASVSTGRRDRWRQNRRQSDRCQRITVSGRTMVTVSRSPGKTLVMAAMLRRSHGLRRGRGALRPNTMTCWRSKAFSAMSLERPRKASRTKPRKTRKNSRNMAKHHSGRPLPGRIPGPYGVFAANSEGLNKPSPRLSATKASPNSVSSRS